MQVIYFMHNHFFILNVYTLKYTKHMPQPFPGGCISCMQKTYLNCFALDWLDHHERKYKVNSSKANLNSVLFCAQFARAVRGIPGAAECDFDVCKNVLRNILRLRATSGGQLNANRLYSKTSLIRTSKIRARPSTGQEF